MCSKCKKARSRFKRWWRWQPSQETKQKWWWVMIKKSKIPGVKDAVQNEIHIGERFFWILAVIATFTVGIIMMIHSHKQFEEKPIVLVFKTSRIPIEKIPFLEMTIGKRNNFRDEFVTKIQGIGEIFEEMKHGKLLEFDGKEWTKDHLKKLAVICHLFCSPYKRGANWYSNDNPPRSADALDFLWFNLDSHKLFDDGIDHALEDKSVPLIREGTTKCTEMFLACTWNSNEVNCSDLFRDVYTDSGSACSFNAIPSYHSRKHATFTTLMEKVQEDLSKEEIEAWNRWDVDENEKGMFVKTNVTIGGRNITIPDSQQKHGQWFGLGFIIKYPKLGEFCRQSDTDEYKMTVGFPANEPDLRNRGIIIPPNHKVINRVKPTVIIADPDIKSAEPAEKRGCYFSDEMELAYYNKYTEENCLKECLIQEIRAICNCINFFHPRDPEKGIRICTSVQDEICVKKVETELFTIKRSEKCGACLPSCNQVSYDIMTSMTPYPEEGSPELVNDLAGMEIQEPTSIVVTSMEEATVVVITAEKRFDSVEKLGIMGGVLGLTNNITFMDIAKILVAMFGLIVPIKAFLDVLTFLFQRALNQLRGQGEADLWMELFKLPMTIAQPREDLGVVDAFSQLPPIIQEFLADYKQKVVESQPFQPEDDLGDISAFQRPSTSKKNPPASSGLRHRRSSAFSIVPEPLPAIPTWVDFRNWYRHRHAIQEEDSPNESLPSEQNIDENDSNDDNLRGCFNRFRSHFMGKSGSNVKNADIEATVENPTKKESTSVVKTESENENNETRSCFSGFRGINFHFRKANNCTPVVAGPVTLDDIGGDDDGLQNPTFVEEFRNEVTVVVTPPDTDAPEQIC